MPALSFSCRNKKQALINKECSQTIRPKRKNPNFRVGDRLYIYWKQRVPEEKKDVHKIGEGIVTQVDSIRFTPTRAMGSFVEPLSVLAKKDGFESKREMWAWFEKRYSSELYDIDFRIIRWNWE